MQPICEMLLSPEVVKWQGGNRRMIEMVVKFSKNHSDKFCDASKEKTTKTAQIKLNCCYQSLPLIYKLFTATSKGF